MGDSKADIDVINCVSDKGCLAVNSFFPSFQFHCIYSGNHYWIMAYVKCFACSFNIICRRHHKHDCLCAICVLKRRRKEREETARIAKGAFGSGGDKHVRELKQEVL